MLPHSAQTEPFVKGKFRGKDVLYTENRILSASVPEGYYRYEIRHMDENWKRPIELSSIIAVNFWGTMITNEPLQLDASGCIMLKKKDISYNGAVQTLSDYMNAHKSISKTVYQIRPLPQKYQDLVYSQSESDHTYGCIGHLRGDFDKGNGFYTTWFDHIPELKSTMFKSELDNIVNWLREDNNPLHNLQDMNHFCYIYGRNAGMQTPDTAYAFCVEGKHYQYLFRMQPHPGDYNFYVYCYDKNAAEIKLDLVTPRQQPEPTI